LAIRALKCPRFHTNRNGRFYGLIRKLAGYRLRKRSLNRAYFTALEQDPELSKLR
jgi:hypothetical protein